MSSAPRGGRTGAATARLDESGIGAGLPQSMEILTTDPARVVRAVSGVSGIAAVAPAAWQLAGTADGLSLVDAWTTAGASSAAGQRAVTRARSAAERAGGMVGGAAVQNGDWTHAVYDNAKWLVRLILAVTFALLAWALNALDEVSSAWDGRSRDAGRSGTVVRGGGGGAGPGCPVR